jgi:dienelactone hydrolase
MLGYVAVSGQRRHRAYREVGSARKRVRPRAIRWLAANAERELGAGRLIVGGESARAHLAALALLVLRDCGEIEAVSAANLAYGVYDISMTPSARRWGDRRVVIHTPDLAFFAAQYARAARHRHPDVSPLYADLTGMPTALFSCGTLDPLLDDTLFIATRWQAAGSPAQLAIYPGAPHEFLNLRDPIPAAPDARQQVYELTGPQAQNMDGVAEEYSRALGKQVEYLDVPSHERTQARAGLPEHLPGLLVTMARLHRDNRYGRVTRTVEQLTGQPARASRHS